MEGDRVNKKDEIELAMQQVRVVRIVYLFCKVLEIFDKSNIWVILWIDL